MKALLAFLKDNKITHYPNSEIKPYVSMKIGGKIKLIIIVKRYALLKSLTEKISGCGFPLVLIGGGTNVVFSNSYSPIIVIVNRTTGIFRLDHNLIRVNSGVSNQLLVRWCWQNNFSGLEFLAGIPGSIGGAAAVNAGAFGKSLSDILKEAEIFDKQNSVHQVCKDFFQYGYRDSIFRTGYRIILNVSLSGHPADRDQILNSIQKNIQHRKKNHPPYSQFTAGCFFKNPLIHNTRISAGKIIADTELAGTSYGDLYISDKHANFIVNRGQAGFRDLRILEKKIVEKIFREKGTRLEREIIYISSSGRKY